MKKLLVVNGPNINLVGIRETQYYGTESWETIENRIKKRADKLNISLLCFQSNHIGVIVDFLQEHMLSADGVIINPAGYSNTGYPILDALTMKDTPFVEVHLSNIHARGGWHKESIFSNHATGYICGFKGYVYDLALEALINHSSK